MSATEPDHHPQAMPLTLEWDSRNGRSSWRIRRGEAADAEPMTFHNASRVSLRRLRDQPAG
jgi:hypothetical protein